MPAALIVVGLGFGDEGKGSVVDHLVRKHRIPAVVRFNGGAQALHYVVDGERKHGFSQFGAGTFAGARTILSRFMLFEPLSFCREAHTLSELGVSDPFSLVSVSELAPVITPLNILANKIFEAHRGDARHGSCGMGIGLTQADAEILGDAALRAGDLRRPAVLRDKLADLRRRRLDDVAPLDGPATDELIHRLAETDLDDLARFYLECSENLDIITEDRLRDTLARIDLVFEGAQGALLDQRLGFFPHVTRSTTTFENAQTLLREAGREPGTRIGLLRGYATRHGAGPLPTETADLRVPPCDNEANDWQGAFRTGWFDAVCARYALAAIGGVDLLGLTNLDRLMGHRGLKAAIRYGPQSLFPDGRIPPASECLEESGQRTATLRHATPDYILLPTIESTDPSDLFRYADAIGEVLNQTVGFVSARPDSHKVYRSG